MQFEARTISQTRVQVLIGAARGESHEKDISRLKHEFTDCWAVAGPEESGVNKPALTLDSMGDCDDLLPRVAAYYTYLKALPRRVRKALQRQWRLPLAGVALMLALGQSPALAATIPVGGNCTLVDAITAANTDDATGGCRAGNGADTIVLPAGSTQTLTQVNNSTYGATGLPVINSPMIIEGQGSTIRRDSAAPEFRLFAVGNTGELTLQETTVTGGVVIGSDGGGVLNNGTLALFDSVVIHNYSSGGGGIANPFGTVTVHNSTISDNSASGGGGLANSSPGTMTVHNSSIMRNKGYNAIQNFYGSLTVTKSLISRNMGAGINNSGTLAVEDSVISYNYGRALSNGYFANLTLTNSIITGNTTALVGGGIINSGRTTITTSTISNNSSAYGGGGIFNEQGTLTVVNSTIAGNSTGRTGGGIANYAYDIYGGRSTLIILRSSIAKNAATGSGGGLSNYASGGSYGNVATATIIGSTISGNTAVASGGGIANYAVFSSAQTSITIIGSTISGNTAIAGGGGIANSYCYDFNCEPSSGNQATAILAQSLIVGNVAPTAPEFLNSSANIMANAYNLFGFNGNAGVEGFTPGPTDIVPPAGVQLSDILNPVLAFNGGPTQTHALVPGSPAIDAGDPTCTDTTGNPLLTDQRGKPRVVDGNRDGTARCDIGAFEFFPVVNNLVTLDPDLNTSFDPTPLPDAPAGSFTINATFTNTSGTPLRFPFFTVTELSGDNVLLNAEEGPRGVGATVTPNVGDQVLSSGETINVNFVIGLQTPAPFTFFVDLFAEPVVSGSIAARQRPSAAPKSVRR